MKVFGTEPSARALLRDLVMLYKVGQVSPLPFFVDAAETYVKARTKGDGHDEALARISANTRTAEIRRDLDDPYVRQVFGALSHEDLGLLQAAGHGSDTSFGALSLRILGPMLANAERSSPA